MCALRTGRPRACRLKTGILPVFNFTDYTNEKEAARLKSLAASACRKSAVRKGTERKRATRETHQGFLSFSIRSFLELFKGPKNLLRLSKRHFRQPDSRPKRRLLCLCDRKAILCQHGLDAGQILRRGRAHGGAELPDLPAQQFQRGFHRNGVHIAEQGVAELL